MAWEAVGVSGVPGREPMVEILHLLVRAQGTTEPVWRLSQDLNRPGYSWAEIEAFSQEKKIALLGAPIPVPPTGMAISVHTDFETFFLETCGETFQQEMGGVRWQPLDGLDAVVAVGSLDTLLALRAWAAGRLVPRVREKLSQVCRQMVYGQAQASIATLDLLFEPFHHFLETALFSVDSVSGGEYLEFLYWQGAAYLLQKYEAGVSDVHEFQASHVIPTCSREDFYREVRFRKNTILEEAIATVGMETMVEAIVATPQRDYTSNKLIRFSPEPKEKVATTGEWNTSLEQKFGHLPKKSHAAMEYFGTEEYVSEMLDKWGLSEERYGIPVS